MDSSPGSKKQVARSHVAVSTAEPDEQKKTAVVSTFRPYAHRPISLAVLLVVVLALVGLLEYGLRTLPQTSFNLPTSHSNTKGARPQTGSTRAGHDDQLARSRTKPKKATRLADPVEADASTVPCTIGEESYMIPAYKRADTAIAISTPVKLHQVSEDPAAATIHQGISTEASIIAPSHISYLELIATATTYTTSEATSVSGVSSPSLLPSMNTAKVHDTTTSASAEMFSGSPSSSVISTPSVPGSLDSLQLDSWDSNVPLTLGNKPGNYFSAVYLPVLIAVVPRLMFGYMYRCTKLMDPFFMLTQRGGVSSEELFAADHLGNESILAPWHAFRSRRWVLLAVSFAYAGTQLLTALAGELSSIHPSRYSAAATDMTTPAQGLALWIDATLGRICQTILILIALILVLMGVMLRKHNSGVATNPASVGTIMSLNSHPCIVSYLSNIDSAAGGTKVSKQITEHRYTLGYYTSTSGVQLYGIIPVVHSPTATDTDEKAVSTGTCKSSSRASGTPVHRESSLQSLLKTRARELFPLILFTCASIILFAIVLSYFLTSTSTQFEHFMDTGRFGPRFLLTVLALLLKSPLLSLCARATAAAPFRRLARRPRWADDDLLSPVPITPLGSIWYALQRGEWLTASLAVAGGFVVEVMIILIPGVPYSASQLWLAALASWYGCLTCLSIFLLVAVAAWVTAIRTSMRGQHEGPRQPTRFNSIGSICRFTAGSHAATDFAQSLAAAEREASKSGVGINASWMDDVRRPDAAYDFAPRDGRWLVDYAGVPREEEDASSCSTSESGHTRYSL